MNAPLSPEQIRNMGQRRADLLKELGSCYSTLGQIEEVRLTDYTEEQAQNMAWMENRMAERMVAAADELESINTLAMLRGGL